MKVKKADVLYDYVEIKNLKDMLEKSANQYKDKVAFQYKRSDCSGDSTKLVTEACQGVHSRNKENSKVHEVTYKQFGSNVNSLGTALIDMGLKNKKIAVIGANSYKWAVTYFAVVCGVGVIVPIDKALPTEEIDNLLKKSKAEAVFFDHKYTEDIIDIKKNNESLKYLVCFEEGKDSLSIDELIVKGKKLIENGNTEFINSTIHESKMSIMLFTSGTTLKSKAVMLSHNNICSNIIGLSQCLQYRQEDILLSFLPIHHTYESTVTLIAGVYNGCTIAFCEGLKYVVQNLSDFKATFFATVPLVLENMYKKIMSQVQSSEGKIKGEDVLKSIAPNLRRVLVGAAPLNKEVIVGFRKLGLDVRQGYGLTETSPILTLETDNLQKSGSIGVSLPNIEVEIENPDGNGLR